MRYISIESKQKKKYSMRKKKIQCDEYNQISN